MPAQPTLRFLFPFQKYHDQVCLQTWLRNIHLTSFATKDHFEWNLEARGAPESLAGFDFRGASTVKEGTF